MSLLLRNVIKGIHLAIKVAQLLFYHSFIWTEMHFKVFLTSLNWNALQGVSYIFELKCTSRCFLHLWTEMHFSVFLTSLNWNALQCVSYIFELKCTSVCFLHLLQLWSSYSFLKFLPQLIHSIQHFLLFMDPLLAFRNSLNYRCEEDNSCNL